MAGLKVALLFTTAEELTISHKAAIVTILQSVACAEPNTGSTVTALAGLAGLG